MPDLSIPKTQHAIVFDETNGPLQYKTDFPVTQQHELKPGEALVRVHYSGVCLSDLHIHKGSWPFPCKLPLVPGHEGAGEIVALADHTPTPLAVGSRVGIKALGSSCLQCDYCRAGQEILCPRAKNVGHGVDGTFQQYCVAWVSHLTPIPDGVPLEVAAPVLCAGVTVYKALKSANVKPGDYVLIAGAGGGLGHLAVQYARAMNLRVVGVDTGADKREMVLGYGADTFLDFRAFPNPADLTAAIVAASAGLGPHAAIIASGSGAAYNDALHYLRANGTLVCVGLPTDTWISADVMLTVSKALKIVGSFVGNRQDAVEALDFVARGRVMPRVSVEPLEKVGEVFEKLEKGQISGRVVVKCA